MKTPTLIFCSLLLGTSLCATQAMAQVTPPPPPTTSVRTPTGYSCGTFDESYPGQPSVGVHIAFPHGGTVGDVIENLIQQLYNEGDCPDAIVAAVEADELALGFTSDPCSASDNLPQNENGCRSNVGTGGGGTGGCYVYRNGVVISGSYACF